MTTNTVDRADADLEDDGSQARKQAAAAMGRARTARKTEAARANGRLGGRPLAQLSDIPCTCGAGDALTGHKTRCARGLAIQRRRAACLPAP